MHYLMKSAHKIALKTIKCHGPNTDNQCSTAPLYNINQMLNNKPGLSQPHIAKGTRITDCFSAVYAKRKWRPVTAVPCWEHGTRADRCWCYTACTRSCCPNWAAAERPALPSAIMPPVHWNDRLPWMFPNPLSCLFHSEVNLEHQLVLILASVSSEEYFTLIPL